MTGTNARKLATYLRTQKASSIKVFTKYDAELGMWTVVINNKRNGIIDVFHLITRGTVRAMAVLARDTYRW